MPDNNTPVVEQKPPAAAVPTEVAAVEVVAPKPKEVAPKASDFFSRVVVGALGGAANAVKNTPGNMADSGVGGVKAAAHIPVALAKGDYMGAALDASSVYNGVQTVTNPWGVVVGGVASSAIAGGVGSAINPHPQSAPAPEPTTTVAQSTSTPPVPKSLEGVPAHVLAAAQDIGNVAKNSNGVVNPATAAKQNTQTAGIA